MDEYGKYLIDLYKNGLIHIEWLKNGQALKFEDCVKFDNINRKEFITYTFRIVKIVRNILLGKESVDVNEDEYALAEQMAQDEQENKDALYLKSISLLDTYNSVEYDILSHYNKNSGNSTKSAIIKFNYDKIDDEDTQNVKMEISKMDLSKLIDSLNEILNQLD